MNIAHIAVPNAGCSGPWRRCHDAGVVNKGGRQQMGPGTHPDRDPESATAASELQVKSGGLLNTFFASLPIDTRRKWRKGKKRRKKSRAADEKRKEREREGEGRKEEEERGRSLLQEKRRIGENAFLCSLDTRVYT